MLLLDEPLGALDLKLRRQMQVELKQIQREVGITFVYVTHDQEEALSMSDRIAVMNAGKVAQCGAPEDVYEHPSGEFVAGFIGISNLLEGEVVGRRQGPDRDRPGDRGRRPRRLRAGRPRQLSIRPEKIAIDEEVEEGMVAMTGTVEARVYLGVMTQITVGLGDGVAARRARAGEAPGERRRPLGAGDGGEDRVGTGQLPRPQNVRVPTPHLKGSDPLGL